MNSSLPKPVYVSITGLRLKRRWNVFAFFRYAIPSFQQAKKAKGNVHAQVRTVSGVHYTLTGWDSKENMLTYISTGIHLKAMQVFRKYFVGKTCGFEAAKIPTWDEAISILEREGKQY